MTNRSIKCYCSQWFHPFTHLWTQRQAREQLRSWSLGLICKWEAQPGIESRIKGWKMAKCFSAPRNRWEGSTWWRWSWKRQRRHLPLSLQQECSCSLAQYCPTWLSSGPCWWARHWKKRRQPPAGKGIRMALLTGMPRRWSWRKCGWCKNRVGLAGQRGYPCLDCILCQLLCLFCRLVSQIV